MEFQLKIGLPIQMDKEILFKTREEWRKWLENNHDKQSVVWLIYYKKYTKKQSVKQPEAVEDALCYGWIDSIVKRVDEEKYMQKFTPRNEKSIWSDLNKKRVSKLIKEDRMTPYGMKLINAAKKNGSWTKIKRLTNINKIPIELADALSHNNAAKLNFENLAPSHKKQYLYWIGDAKRDDTRKRRIIKVIELLSQNSKLGIV